MVAKDLVAVRPEMAARCNFHAAVSPGSVLALPHPCVRGAG